MSALHASSPLWLPRVGMRVVAWLGCARHFFFHSKNPDSYLYLNRALQCTVVIFLCVFSLLFSCYFILFYFHTFSIEFSLHERFQRCWCCGRHSTDAEG
jgi:hypothetical protein